MSGPDPLVEAPAAKQVAARQRVHALIAKSSTARVGDCFKSMAVLPSRTALRPTEVGLVMVRGRVGGDGQQFNLGELPVARAAVRIDGGADDLGLVGIGYVAGRDPVHAEWAALADAMIQSDAWREPLEDLVLGPLAAELAERKAEAGRKAAATRVEFFTMVRTRAEK